MQLEGIPYAHVLAKINLMKSPLYCYEVIMWQLWYKDNANFIKN